MSKKLLAGILLGSSATAAGWKLLPKEKRQAVREQVGDHVAKWTDAATDYALNALDIIDERLAEMDSNELINGLKDVRQSVKDKEERVVDHLTNDQFDEQTAAIREKLAQARKQDRQDDIVIDATSDQKDHQDEDK